MSVVFFGMKKHFQEGTSPFCQILLNIKKSAPNLLVVIGSLFIVIAVLFCFWEITAIKNFAGLIGPRMMMGFFSGIAGSLALSANMHLKG